MIPLVLDTTKTTIALSLTADNLSSIGTINGAAANKIPLDEEEDEGDDGNRPVEVVLEERKGEGVEVELGSVKEGSGFFDRGFAWTFVERTR